MKNDQFRALQEIKQRNRERLLLPSEIVRSARKPSSPLHSAFTWDDTKAAREYRLWQARELIIEFRIIEPKSQAEIRAWVSLKSDRRAGGYRGQIDVLRNPVQRAEWLAMAIDELESWANRYAALTELDPVFADLVKIRERYAVA